MMAQADTSDANYYGVIRITNNSTVTNNVAANLSISTPAWISTGILNSSANDTTIQDAVGLDTAFMPGYDTNPWIFYVDSVSANGSLNNTLYASNVTGVSPWYFPNTGGMTVLDNAEMELGTTKFNIEYQAIFDTSSGSIGSDIIDKGTSDYCRIYVSDTNELTVFIDSTGGAGGEVSFTATMTSGKHKLNWVRASTGSGNMTLNIDDVYAGSVALGAAGPYDSGDDWNFCESPAVIAMEYIDWNVNDTQTGYWIWEYNTTFTDQSGNDNTATPTFRTSCSSENVTASLISFSPISEAKSTTTGTGDWPELIEDTPEEPETAYDEEERPGIFFEPIVYALANASGVPESFFFYIFSFLVIIIPIGMLSYRIHPSLTIKGAVMLSLIVLFAAPGLNMFGMFTAIYFAMAGAGLILISRSYGI